MERIQNIFRHAWHNTLLDSRMYQDVGLMKPHDKILVRKLAIVLVIKLVVLTALWWAFVREQRVVVDDDAAATQMLRAEHIKPEE